ncbi:unnamed protein product [Polarella glacialis]|uniref:Uncharacterized protein n=1 Tax=Polarella glacialis TaxID=89957 RepID=A0A813GSL6_POLGL|nr:unnamed protein product [Polarella glacialis]
MRSASTTSHGADLSSTTSVPVLAQIEGTAPRTAATHDISHLCDQPKFLAPSVPATLIEEEDHVFETSFMAKDATSVYSDADGLWHTKVFPSDCPSSRTDAVMLDTWITKALDRYQKKALPEASSSRADFGKTVEDLVPILSVSLHEIVRQVMHHCSERGLALQKIWKTYVELFDRVLHQMQDSLRQQKLKTAEVQSFLGEASSEFKELKRSHPVQMHNVISDLEVTFTESQKGFEDDLKQAEEENGLLKQMLRTHHRELEMWYPNFQLYQDSYIKNLIPQRVKGRAPRRAPTTRLEDRLVAIAEDFKRLLTVLAPDKRKTMGQDLAGLLDAREQDRAKEKVSLEAQQENLDLVEKLQAEVREQEEHIKLLKTEIAKIEAKKAFGGDDDHSERDMDEVSVDLNADDLNEVGGGSLLQAAAGLLKKKTADTGQVSKGQSFLAAEFNPSRMKLSIGPKDDDESASSDGGSSLSN